MRKNLFIFSILSILSLSLSFYFLHDRSAAVTAIDWSPGRIIDDVVFFNKNSMSVSEIQYFLSSKVPVCDTQGAQIYSGSTTRAVYGASKGHSAPYTCLKDYVENPTTHQNNYSSPGTTVAGGITSAQIIWNVSQQYGINPQVLLTTLQKEQGLITDDWPWQSQYIHAMGANCPDTPSGCDPAYSGFQTQVDRAAYLFTYYVGHLNEFSFNVGQNYVLWNIQSSGCGGSTINISNVATALLYIYTPYQPNSASVNSFPGQGDGCSSYGNRNFWYYFNNWFGSSKSGQLPSPVYKGVNGTQLFVVWSGVKYYIPTYDILIAWGLHRYPVNIIADSYLDQLATGDNLTGMAKASDGGDQNLYLLDDGKRYTVPIAACSKDLSGNINAQTTWGLDCFNSLVSKSFPGALLKTYTVQDITLPNMMAFSNSVWKLENGKKRKIVDSFVIDVLGGWANIRWMKDSNANQPIGKILMRNGYTVRFSNSQTVYLNDNGMLMPVLSPADMVAWGLDKSPINDFPSSYNSSDPLTIGPSITRVAKDSNNNYFLVDKGYKLPLSGDLAQWPTSTATYAPDQLSSMISIPLSNVYLSDSGEIFTVYASNRYIFPTMADFFSLGFKTSAIRKVSKEIEYLPGISYGGMHLASGRLFKINNNLNQIYIVNGSISQYVNQINYPGLPYDSLITVDPTTAMRYPVAGTYTP